MKMYIHDRTRDIAGALVFALLIALVSWRLTRGVDLSDEAYYAIFLDDWLKGGIRTSAFLALHQTAALIVYPFALLYAKIIGSTNGLFLFLRVLYLAGAVASAIIWILFLRRLGHRAYAWVGGILVVAFVPFGLPAPSYNTLGQQALAIALASFGCAALADAGSRKQVRWLVASACAWSGATVSYPSLIVPLSLLCAMGLLYRNRGFPRAYLFIGITVMALCLAWVATVLSLSFGRLYESVVYLSAINDVGGFSRKLAFTLEVLRAKPFFAALCALAVLVGLLRQHLGPLVTQSATAAIIAGLFLTTPSLYARSHDAVTLAALTGLGLLSGLQFNASQADRVIALVYATSVTAALTYCFTANNSVFNFCIGALPAAVLAIVGSPWLKPAKWTGAAQAAAVACAILPTSLFFLYGELPGQTPPARERLHDGFFAGLAVHPYDAELLRLTRQHIAPLVERGQTIAVFSRSPGIALDLPARLAMSSAFPLMPAIPRKGIEMTHDFYARLEKRPTFVVIYEDPYFPLINPLQPRFDEWYEPLMEFKTMYGRLAVFKARSAES